MTVDDAREPVTAAGRAFAFDWTPLVRWPCVRCDRWFITRSADPRCPFRGFSETRE